MRLRAAGLIAWWVQRVSAVFMLLFTVLVLGSLLIHPIHSYAEWRIWVGHPAVAIAAGSFFAALLSHIWVGLRDVLIDYPRPASLRLFLLCAAAAALLATAGWVLRILLRTQG